MKFFEDFTTEDLRQLRNEIVLNSIYVSDYENSFGISAKSVSDFFDGYMDYLSELVEEEKGSKKDITIDEIFAKDNISTLEEWYYCHDSFEWVEYDTNEDEEEDY